MTEILTYWAGDERGNDFSATRQDFPWCVPIASQSPQAAGVAMWSTLFFALFILAATVLFGGVLWSKFAHMFFKPAAAFQKRVAKADGSRDGLPEPADRPEQFGPGIKRLAPRNY